MEYIKATYCFIQQVLILIIMEDTHGDLNQYNKVKMTLKS